MTRLPPQALDAERAVLGSILLDNGVLATIRGIMVKDDLYAEKHRIIFGVLDGLIGTESPADLVTVTNELAANGKLDQVGGAVYVSKLVDGVVTTVNASSYARVVREHALRRRAINTSREIATKLFAGEISAVDASYEMAYIAQTIQQDHRGEENKQRLMAEHSRMVARRKAGVVTFQSTGFPLMDVGLAEGLATGCVSIWGGRPSMGKTTLMASMVRKLVAGGTKVLAMPFETGASKFLDMMVCGEAGVPIATLLKSPTMLSDGQWQTMNEAAERITDMTEILDLPLAKKKNGYTDNRNERAMDVLESMIAGHTAPVVMIDMWESLLASRDAQDIDYALARVRQMVKHYAVHVALFVHVGRAVEHRRISNKDRAALKDVRRPTLTDFRNSGGYENAADLAAGLYRPKYYYPEIDDDRLEVQWMKQRTGLPASGIVVLQFDPAVCDVREYVGPVPSPFAAADDCTPAPDPEQTELELP